MRKRVSIQVSICRRFGRLVEDSNLPFLVPDAATSIRGFVAPSALTNIRCIATHLVVKSYIFTQCQYLISSLYLNSRHRWLHIFFPVHNRVGLIVQTVI